MNRKRESGFAGIVFLTMLPLLLAAAALCASVFLLLKAHAGALHECRSGLLRIENLRLGQLQQLMKLNPQARKLRRERARAELNFRMAKASGSPKAIAAARVALEVVRAKQFALATQQRRILLRERVQTKANLARLKKNVESKLREHQLAAPSRGFPLPTAAYGSLAVRTAPPGDLTPDYVPRENFERHQAIRMRWNFTPAMLLPTWLNFEKFKNLTLDAQCGTTAERKSKNTWRARLNADKRPLSW